MRHNQLSGPLLNFAKLPNLLNVWFDTQTGADPLTGTLTALGALSNLTFLQASHTGVSGVLPARLCGITCDAGGTDVSCAADLPTGCCSMPSCGDAPPAPPPPPASMGECFPQ